MAYSFPKDLVVLVQLLKKLPGVGIKTAERFAFEMLKWSKEDLSQFGENLQTLHEKVFPCSTCGCLTEQGVCHFCESLTRDSTLLCILASPKDVYAIEETKTYRGLYHVVEHLLSPLDGRHIHTLKIDRIVARIEKQAIREIILAFDSTLEGDTTALYLKKELSHFPISISRLAFGIPIGSSLEYIDGSTLARALTGRQSL